MNGPDTEAHALRQELRERMLASLRSGPRDFRGLLSAALGADPRLAREVLDGLLSTHEIVEEQNVYSLPSYKPMPNWPSARDSVGRLIDQLPPADPMNCQWWFTPDTLWQLAEAIWQRSPGDSCAFLGAPLLGYFYAKAGAGRASILDSDADVLSALGQLPQMTLYTYDALQDLPQALRAQHDVVATDPPWYPAITEAFLVRAVELARPGGLVFCALPAPLTRPNLMGERTAFMATLTKLGLGVIAVQAGELAYVVPAFESSAYNDVQGFDGRAWRRADLLIARIPESVSLPQTKFASGAPALSYWRGPGSPRVFLRPAVSVAAGIPQLVEIPEFQRTVSLRQMPSEDLVVWTSGRRGFKASGTELLTKVLEAWKAGHDRSAAENIVEETGAGPSAAACIEHVSACLGLWGGTDAASSALRRAGKLRELRALCMSEWASKEPERHHPARPDAFRLEFQRDRDRITWSRALKRLGSKMQVLPFETASAVRCRLTHSLEVAQLADTIARAFGLDTDLTEAVALGHDVGHTPFGHAGEEALDAFLNDVDGRLGGFTHYEHGVDVLRWLEDAYMSPGAGGFAGLGLTALVLEGAFKHMFNRSSGTKCQTELYSRSKHQDQFGNDSCHLEGQAVRVADKISYLVADLEDGLRSRALDLGAVRKCRLFERPAIDLRPRGGEADIERFISQRGAILSLLMTDVLQETERQLASCGSPGAVRAHPGYCVTHSPEVLSQITEVWREVQCRVLHRDRRVARANLRAHLIVRELLSLFAFCPDLIEDDFATSWSAIQLAALAYSQRYCDRVQGPNVEVPKHLGDRLYSTLARDPAISEKMSTFVVPVRNVIVSKDYVAAMTDDEAEKIHAELISGRMGHG